MPIEIKEVVVRAIVDPGAGGNSGGGGGGGDKKAVAKAVDQVMRILKEKKER